MLFRSETSWLPILLTSSMSALLASHLWGVGRCEYGLVWESVHVGRYTYGGVCEWAGVSDERAELCFELEAAGEEANWPAFLMWDAS